MQDSHLYGNQQHHEQGERREETYFCKQNHSHSIYFSQTEHKNQHTVTYVVVMTYLYRYYSIINYCKFAAK